MSESESRLEALAAREKHLAQLGQRVENLSKDFHTLSAAAEGLRAKQAALETPGERLEQVDAIATQTTAQFEGLK